MTCSTLAACTATANFGHCYKSMCVAVKKEGGQDAKILIECSQCVSRSLIKHEKHLRDGSLCEAVRCYAMRVGNVWQTAQDMLHVAR